MAPPYGTHSVMDSGSIRPGKCDSIPHNHKSFSKILKIFPATRVKTFKSVGEGPDCENFKNYNFESQEEIRSLPVPKEMETLAKTLREIHEDRMKVFEVQMEQFFKPERKNFKNDGDKNDWMRLRIKSDGENYD